MRRRAFIAALGGAAAWPLVARAQKQGQTVRVGILNYFDARYSLVTEFTEALRELGYIEGQNLRLFIDGPVVSSIVCRPSLLNSLRAKLT